MSVLTSSSVTGLTRKQYDEIAAILTDRLKAAPGFIAHYAWEDDTGMRVVEVWESAPLHDDWFNNNVRPHLPTEVTPEKHELANIVAP
jgi:heme-degrading monooxygenase HmoA